MDFNKLVQSLESEKTWKETNIYKKQLQQDNIEIVDELITNLDKIINDKKMKPMVRLGAVRLFKTCLEAGNEYYNMMVAESALLGKLVEYTKISPNTHIFSNKPDQREQSISNTFRTYILEGFLFWSQWFPSTKFHEYYEIMKKQGIKFPDLQKNGQLQKMQRGDDQANQQKLQQSQANNQQQLQQSQQNKQQQQLKQSQTPTNPGGMQGQLYSDEQIQEKISEYDNMRSIMVDMLENMEDGNEDLQMFTESFNEFINFTNKINIDNLDVRLQEHILDKAEECNDICIYFEQFFQGKLPFQNMKSAVLQLCQKSQNNHNNADNQKQLKEQEEFLRQQHEAEEQRRIQLEREIKQQEELDNQRKQQELLQQQQIKKENEERQRQEQLQLQKKQEEEKRIQEEKRQQEEQARLKKQKEDEQLRQEQQRLKEQEEQKLKQKAIEEEKQRKQQLELQQQQEEQRRQQEIKKNKDFSSNQHRIAEDQDEYEEEEERKSQHQIKNNNNNYNQPPSSQIKPGQGLYNTPEMMQLKNQNQGNSNTQFKPPSNSQIQNKPNQIDNNKGSFGFQSIPQQQNNNNNQLMGFDDDDFLYNSEIKNKQPNQSSQSHISSGPVMPQSQINQNNNQKQQSLSHLPLQQQQQSQQSQIQNASQSQVVRNSETEISNNQPYSSLGQSKKNPFTNQPTNPIPPPNSDNSQQMNQPLAKPKNHGNYFGEEEFYEPQATQMNQTRLPQQNPLANTHNHNNTNRDSQRMEFEASNNIDDDEEFEQIQQIPNKNMNNLNQFRAGMPAQLQLNEKKQSYLDQSGNIDQDMNDSSLKGQIKQLNSTIAPKTKPKEEQVRMPANPNQINQSDPQQTHHLPFTKLEPKNNNTLIAYPFNNKSNIPTGFEPVSFNQPSTLRSQIVSSSQIKDNNQELSQSRFMQALHNNDDRSHIRDTQEDRIPSQQSFTDGRRVPIFSKDKQINTELNQLKQQFNELRREKDIEISKLQSELTQLSIKNRDLEAKLNVKNQEEGQFTRLAGQEKQDLEKRLQDKDKTIFQQKQFIEQQLRDLEQQKSIIKQYEQQKIEQHQILIDKKKAMEDENQKTRQQLQDYINTTQKQHNSHLESMQRSLNQLEEDSRKYQSDLQQRELENSEMRNELRLLKSKESNFNQNYIRDKDNKIAELRSKTEILTQELEFRDDKIKDLQQEVLALKKAVDDVKEDFGTTESQIQIYKENIIQKDIEINQIKQTVFEKEQVIYTKEQALLQLEHTISKKKEIIDQFKGSSENQIKKFHERIEEQEQEIKTLQREKNDLENRIDSLSIQHREEIDRIIQASRLNEEEKKIFKEMMDENERLKNERSVQVLKEQNTQSQILQLQKTITHLKKENEMQEQNMEDLVIANNLITKKLYDRDDQFTKEQEIKERDLELKENEIQC